MKMQYYDGCKENSADCGSPEVIREIMRLRFDMGYGCSSYNYFYFSENGENDDEQQFWIDVNNDYAFLYYIDGELQWQALNDDNELDPKGESFIIPMTPAIDNIYLVTMEAAVKAAIEFCATKSRPTNIQWEALQEENNF